MFQSDRICDTCTKHCHRLRAQNTQEFRSMSGRRYESWPARRAARERCEVPSCLTLTCHIDFAGRLVEKVLKHHVNIPAVPGRLDQRVIICIRITYTASGLELTAVPKKLVISRKVDTLFRATQPVPAILVCTHHAKILHRECLPTCSNTQKSL